MSDEKRGEQVWAQIVESCMSDYGGSINVGSDIRRAAVLWANEQVYATRPDVSAIPDSDIITGLKQERGSLRHRVEKLRGQRDKAEDKLLDVSAIVEAARKASQVLDDLLGDTDPDLLDDHGEDMSSDDIKQEYPMFWACRELFIALAAHDSQQAERSKT